MEEKTGQIATDADALIESKWRSLPFDAVTNFSLLGWILDKLRKGEKTEEKIDLRLDA